jgi:ferredoxin like protein
MSEHVNPADVRVEDKLYQNRYLVDAGRPHIRIVNPAGTSPALQALASICPAGCYAKADDGTVELTPDGCMECGTCRILCEGTGDIEWNYPRGGYGVLFKFG